MSRFILARAPAFVFFRYATMTRSFLTTTRQVASPSFSDRIKLLIKACGSVSHIARTCGFSEGVVRSWRDGRSDPSRERCLALARGLGVSLLWLMAGEGAMWDDTDRRPAPMAMARHSASRATISPGVDVKNATMDAHRLNAAMHALQSTLELAHSGLTVSDTPDLLAELYTVMGQADPLARAEGLSRIHRQIAERSARRRSA